MTVAYPDWRVQQAQPFTLAGQLRLNPRQRLRFTESALGTFPLQTWTDLGPASLQSLIGHLRQVCEERAHGIHPVLCCCMMTGPNRGSVTQSAALRRYDWTKSILDKVVGSADRAQRWYYASSPRPKFFEIYGISNSGCVTASKMANVECPIAGYL